MSKYLLMRVVATTLLATFFVGEGWVGSRYQADEQDFSNTEAMTGKYQYVRYAKSVDTDVAGYPLTLGGNVAGSSGKDILERLPTQPASRIHELLPHHWPAVSGRY